jgi:hypothetical protein
MRPLWTFVTPPFFRVAPTATVTAITGRRASSARPTSTAAEQALTCTGIVEPGLAERQSQSFALKVRYSPPEATRMIAVETQNPQLAWNPG